MIIKRLKDDVYNCRVLFLHSCSAKEVDAFILKKGFTLVPSIKDDSGCHAFMRKIGSHLIWVEDPISFKVLSHEVIHLCVNHLSDLGIEISKGNDECFAYYHTFWFERLWKIMSKKKSKS